MTLVEALREDHTILRNKVALLDSALSSAPHVRLVFREKCFSLTRLLNRHMRREAPLVHAYYERIPSARYLPNPKDHAAEHALLRAITELQLGGLKASIPLLVLRLSQALEQLQEQMDEQERTVFPLFEGVSEVPEISGSMSINALLQRYPQTEKVLEPLHINRLKEGYETVEEVAWRRGMDVVQLLEGLRQAATGFPTY